MTACTWIWTKATPFVLLLTWHFNLPFNHILAFLQHARLCLAALPDITLMGPTHLQVGTGSTVPSSSPSPSHPHASSASPPPPPSQPEQQQQQQQQYQYQLASVAGWDPLRLVVNVSSLGLTGFQAAEWMEQHHGVVSEMATLQLVVLVFGPGSRLEDGQALVAAVQGLIAAVKAKQDACSSLVAGGDAKDHQHQQHQHPPSHQHQQHPLSDPHPQRGPSHPPPQRPLTPQQAFFAPKLRVPLTAAVGRHAGELLCPYPPGVPLLFPGEVVTWEAVGALKGVVQCGGSVTGASDASLDTLLVVGVAEDRK